MMCKDCWFSRNGGLMANLPLNERACDMFGKIVTSTNKSCDRFMVYSQGLRKVKKQL